MNNHELRELFLDLDGAQAARSQMRQPQAWKELQLRFSKQGKSEAQLFFRGLTAGALACILGALLVNTVIPNSSGSNIAMTRAEHSGVYASSFYAPEAGADVIWISGLPESTSQEMTQ